MDCRLLTGDKIDLSDYRLGTPQQAGLLTVVPITAPRASNQFVPFPAEERTKRLAPQDAPPPGNESEPVWLLSPLHYEPVERGNRLLPPRVTPTPPAPRLGLASESVLPDPSTRHSRFAPAQSHFLPLSLRGPAWRLRRSTDPACLTPYWNDLQGHLRRLKLGNLYPAMQGRSPELNVILRRIELLTGQAGALFFLEDRPVGLEIAPSPDYFAALWPSLVRDCYGLTALLRAHDSAHPASAPEPYAVSRLADLRAEMFRVRRQRQEDLESRAAAPAAGEFQVEEEQRWRNYRVQSLTGAAFAGQYVEECMPLKADVGGAGPVPRMLRTLFRKAELPNEERTRRRVLSVSLFALSLS